MAGFIGHGPSVAVAGAMTGSGQDLARMVALNHAAMSPWQEAFRATRTGSW